MKTLLLRNVTDHNLEINLQLPPEDGANWAIPIPAGQTMRLEPLAVEVLELRLTEVAQPGAVALELPVGLRNTAPRPIMVRLDLPGSAVTPRAWYAQLLPGESLSIVPQQVSQVELRLVGDYHPLTELCDHLVELLGRTGWVRWRLIAVQFAAELGAAAPVRVPHRRGRPLPTPPLPDGAVPQDASLVLPLVQGGWRGMRAARDPVTLAESASASLALQAAAQRGWVEIHPVPELLGLTAPEQLVYLTHPLGYDQYCQLTGAEPESNEREDVVSDYIADTPAAIYLALVGRDRLLADGWQEDEELACYFQREDQTAILAAGLSLAELERQLAWDELPDYTCYAMCPDAAARERTARCLLTWVRATQATAYVATLADLATTGWVRVEEALFPAADPTPPADEAGAAAP